MTRPDDLERIVQTLVWLFPSQHPKCREWLDQRSPHALPASARKSSPLSPSRTAADDSGAPSALPGSHPDFSKKGPSTRPVNTPLSTERAMPPDMKEPDLPGKAANPRAQSPKASKALLPSFARPIQDDISQWSDNIVHDFNLSWSDEQDLFEMVAKASGLTTSEMGFRGSLISLQGKLTSRRGKSVSVEVFVPRMTSPSVLLIGIRQEGTTPIVFEVDLSNLTRTNIEQLVQWVVDE